MSNVQEIAVAFYMKAKEAKWKHGFIKWYLRGHLSGRLGACSKHVSSHATIVARRRFTMSRLVARSHAIHNGLGLTRMTGNGIHDEADDSGSSHQSRDDKVGGMFLSMLEGNL